MTDQKPIQNKSSLPGVNVCIMGPTGTGKTHSIGTLVDEGVEVFFFAFEAGVESLYGYWTDRGKEVPANLRTITIEKPTASWSDMAKSVNQINTLAYDSLKKISDPNRRKYNQFEKFLSTFNNVIDNEGTEYGCIDDWGPSRAIVIDGLTGLSNAALTAVVGGKADRDQKDWGLAQNILEVFLRKICDECQCHFILLAHVEREVDEVLGGVKIMVSTLGKKLPPKLPPMFSDTILAVREGDKWLWDTASAKADVKTRNLPISSNNPQTFKTILDKWKSRGGVV